MLLEENKYISMNLSWLSRKASETVNCSLFMVFTIACCGSKDPLNFFYTTWALCLEIITQLCSSFNINLNTHYIVMLLFTDEHTIHSSFNAVDVLLNQKAVTHEIPQADLHPNEKCVFIPFVISIISNYSLPFASTCKYNMLETTPCSRQSVV